MDTFADYYLLINFVCNLVLCCAFVAFIIFCFGRENSLVHKMSLPYNWGLKFALTFCTAGSLLNALSLGELPYDGVFLNIGLASLFVWASIFHYQRFVVNYKKEKTLKKTKNNIKRKKLAKRKVSKI